MSAPDLIPALGALSPNPISDLEQMAGYSFMVQALWAGSIAVHAIEVDFMRRITDGPAVIESPRWRRPPR